MDTKNASTEWIAKGETESKTSSYTMSKEVIRAMNGNECAMPEVEMPVCISCGRRITTREAIYVTSQSAMKKLRRNGYTAGSDPVMTFCLDCLPTHYVEWAVKYDFIMPRMLTTDELKGNWL